MRPFSTTALLLCVLISILPDHATTALSLRRMRYHDNKVKFIFYPRMDNVRFHTFVVKEYEHPRHPSQDPQGYLRVGEAINFQTTSHASETSLTFRLGRHGSHRVADFWNARVLPVESTFNHTANKLNFAIFGDIHGTQVRGGDEVVPFVIPDVALAQGHSGTTNNWWFAARGGRQSEGNTAVVPARGADLCFAFARGTAYRVAQGKSKISRVLVNVRHTCFGESLVKRPNKGV